MAYSEEALLRLVARYEGEADMRKAEADQERLIATMARLKAQYEQGTITQLQYERGLQQNTLAFQSNGRILDDATTKYNRAAGATRDFGRATLEVSRAVEDAQYGIHGVLNNLPTLIGMLGGGPGLAGVVSLVAVGVTVLGPKLLELIRTMEGGADKTKNFTESLKGLEDRIKLLGEKPLKVTADYQELDRLQTKLDDMRKGLAAFQALVNTPTDEQAAAGQSVKDAFVSLAGGDDRKTGGERVAEAVESILRKRGAFHVGQVGELNEFQEQAREAERLRAEVADYDANPRGGIGGAAKRASDARALAAAEARRDELEGRLTAGGRARIQGLIGDASGGNQVAIRQLRDLLGQEPGAFAAAGVDPRFAGGLEEATPERVRQRIADARNQAQDAQARARDEAIAEKARLAAEKEAARIAALNQQGQENQLRAAAEQEKRAEQAARDAEKANAAQLRADEENRRMEEGLRKRAEAALLGGDFEEASNDMLARIAAMPRHMQAQAYIQGRRELELWGEQAALAKNEPPLMAQTFGRMAPEIMQANYEADLLQAQAQAENAGNQLMVAQQLAEMRRLYQAGARDRANARRVLEQAPVENFNPN